MPLLSIALTLFLVANPIGNFPAIIAIIKDFDYKTQRKIMIREALLALSLAIFFQYFGVAFLNTLAVEEYSLQLSGGILLFFVAIFMIFPRHEEGKKEKVKRPPIFVPIATPLIAGPTLLTMAIIFAKEEGNNLKVTLSILAAWVGITFVLAIAPKIQRFLGKRGLTTLEQLMGLILCMMSIEMTLNGLQVFINSLN